MTAPARSPWPRRLALGAVGAGALAAAAWAFAPPPPRVATAVVERGALVEELGEDGVARVRDRYLIAAPIPGTLSRPTLRPGDRVTRGWVVARLAPTAPPLLDARSPSLPRSTARCSVSTSLRPGWWRPGHRCSSSATRGRWRWWSTS